VSTHDPAAGPRQPATAEGVTDAEARRSRRRPDEEGNMLPGRRRRRFGIERLLVRLIATAGVIGIGVALGAILTSSKTAGWIIGLVVAVVSIVLSAMLWSSRQL
jgi:tetrahydromethanopterin S-methyltransferase subunit F